MSGNDVEHRWQQRCFRCRFSICLCQRQAIIFQYLVQIKWANVIIFIAHFFPIFCTLHFAMCSFASSSSQLNFGFSSSKAFKLVVLGKLFGFSFNLALIFYGKQPLHQHLSIHWHQHHNITQHNNKHISMD